MEHLIAMYPADHPRLVRRPVFVHQAPVSELILDCNECRVQRHELIHESARTWHDLGVAVAPQDDVAMEHLAPLVGRLPLVRLVMEQV